MTRRIKSMIVGFRGAEAIGNETISAGYTQALLAYAVSRGADRQMLIERSGVIPDQLADQDNRIPLANCVALMESAVLLCKDPAFALRFGEALPAEQLSVAFLIAASAETVGEGRAHMNRYARLIQDDEGNASELLSLVRDRGGVWLKLRSGIYDHNPHFVEAGFSWCVCEARRMLQVHHAERPFLRAVHFTHEEPGYRAEYDRIFGVPLVFGSDRNAMLIDEHFLSMKLPASNPYAVRVLSKHADAVLANLESSKTIRARVEALVIPRLHTRAVGMDTISGKMGLSRQTLFRRLRAEGVTYKKVLDEVRKKMALHYVGVQKVSVNEAAYLLGFSEPAAFSRAYKRWIGSSPRLERLAKLKRTQLPKRSGQVDGT